MLILISQRYAIKYQASATAWKVHKYGVFSDPYFLVFGLKQENTDHKKLRVWTYFTQCEHIVLLLWSSCFTNFKDWYTQAYSETCQTSGRGRLWKMDQRLAAFDFLCKFLSFRCLVGYWIYIWVHWAISRVTPALCLSCVSDASTQRWHQHFIIFWFYPFQTAFLIYST